MRRTLLAFVCAAAAVLAPSNSGEATAADLGPPAARNRLHAPAEATRVGHRCRRCDDCCDRPHAIAPAYGYYVAPPYAYVPSVVYQGPFGIYRPYPPVVVYDVPVDLPYYANWRDDYIDRWRYHRHRWW